MFVKNSTYPLELLADAQRLAEEATKHPLTDGRKLPSPMERACSRGAVLTAFNFVESLLIELTQQCIRSVDNKVRAIIEADLKYGRASISRTIKEWPKLVGKSEVHGLAEFKHFKALRQVRNNFTHPVYEPLNDNTPTQNELLQQATCSTAAWAVAEAKKMGKALYRSYGAEIPPEVD